MNLEDYQEQGYIQVKVIPNAKKTEIVGIMDNGVVKIRLKALPEKGKANKELISFLAKVLEISKQNISIVSGSTSSLKKIKLEKLK